MGRTGGRSVATIRADLLDLAESSGISLREATTIEEAARTLLSAPGYAVDARRIQALAQGEDVSTYARCSLHIPSDVRDVQIYSANAEELLDEGLIASVVVQTSAAGVWVMAGLPEEFSGELLSLSFTTTGITSGLTDVWAPPERAREDWCPPDLLHLEPEKILAHVHIIALKAWREARRQAGLFA